MLRDLRRGSDRGSVWRCQSNEDRGHHPLWWDSRCHGAEGRNTRCCVRNEGLENITEIVLKSKHDESALVSDAAVRMRIRIHLNGRAVCK